MKTTKHIKSGIYKGWTLVNILKDVSKNIFKKRKKEDWFLSQFELREDK